METRSRGVQAGVLPRNLLTVLEGRYSDRYDILARQREQSRALILRQFVDSTLNTTAGICVVVTFL